MPDDLGTGDLMSLEIYTVDGRRVRTFEVNRTAGWHEVTWDGRDDNGKETWGPILVPGLGLRPL